MLPFIHLLFSLKKTSQTPWSCLFSWRFLGFSSEHQQTCGAGPFALSLTDQQGWAQASPAAFHPIWSDFHHPLMLELLSVISSEIFASLHLRCSEGKGCLSPRPLFTCCREKEGLFARLWLPHLPLAPLDFVADPTCSSLVSMASAALVSLSTKLCWWQGRSSRQESLLQSSL